MVISKQKHCDSFTYRPLAYKRAADALEVVKFDALLHARAIAACFSPIRS